MIARTSASRCEPVARGVYRHGPTRSMTAASTGSLRFRCRTAARSEKVREDFELFTAETYRNRAPFRWRALSRTPILRNAQADQLFSARARRNGARGHHALDLLGGLPAHRRTAAPVDPGRGV